MSNARQEFEQIESQILAPFAVKSVASLGRQHPEKESDNRTCFQRDRDRVIHSKSFRRLKHKTQVFVTTVSDHFRSRLTHTIEVAQISRHLARLLRVNEDLAETIALAHDLGHTPFGHSGEREMNQLMKDHGGFEHNRQSRRVVDELETKYPHYKGLNLSLEVREGLMKHKTPFDHPEHDGGEGFNSIEAQICNLADEVAYNNHDIIDGIESGVLDEIDLGKQVPLWAETRAQIQSEYAALTAEEERTLINSQLISSQIQNILDTSRHAIQDAGISSLSDLQTQAAETLVSFDSEMKEKNAVLRRYLYQNFYFHSKVLRMNKKGQHVIRRLFEAFSDDPKLLPETVKNRLDESNQHRVICDYIAGMTDSFAIQEYTTLFIPRAEFDMV